MKRKLLLFALLLALFAPWAAQAQDELTVYDGTTTNSYVPAYMGYFDDFSRSQCVIPAGDLADMNGGTISSIKFYCTSSNVPYTSVSTVDVYLMEVDYTSMSAFEPTSSGTIVYQGFLDVVTEGDGGSLTIEFDTPYTYGGGNLLVGIENTTDAGYKFIYFYGQTVTGASGAASNSSSLSNVTFTQRNFIPKTTFTYTPGSGPTCDRPAEVTYEDLTSTSVSIRWEGGSGTYNMEYKKTSDTTWTSVLTNSSATSAELTGLTPATDYVAKVQSVCVFDDTTLYRERSVNFTTECAILDTYPYRENFDNMTAGANNALPLCWNYINTTTYSSYQGYPKVYNYNYNSSPNCLYFYSYGYYSSYDPQPQYAILPEMENLGGKQITLLAKGNATTTNLHIGVMTDPTDASTFDEIASQALTTSYAEYIFDIPTDVTGKRVAIMMEAATTTYYSRSINVDDIMIDNPPTCPRPKNLTLVSKTGHEAKVRWVPAVEGQTQWQFSLTQNGTEQIIGPVTSTDSTYTFTGLAGQTTYTVKVRAYCDANDQSDWSATSATFTTDVTCVAPTGFAVSDVTNHGATLKWNSEASEWIVAYKLYSADDNTYVERTVTENPYTLDGLDTLTRYMVKVRANCGDYDGLSSWSSTQNFTTLGAYPEPSKVKCDSVLADKALLSWFERGTAIDWEVAYRFASDTIYTVTELAPENPFWLGEMDALLPDTVYYFKVRSRYPLEVQVDENTWIDTVSVWSSEVSFRTLQTCPAPTNVAVVTGTDSITAYTANLTWNAVYSTSWNVKYRNPAYVDGIIEEFGTALPTGWEMYTGLLSNGTATLSASSYVWSFGTSNGVFDNHARVNIYDNNQRWLVMPEFKVPADIDLSFDIALTAYSYSETELLAPETTGTDDKFIVLISTDGMETWTTLREWNNSGSEYVYNDIANTATGEHVIIDLRAYAGQKVRIAFYGESTTSNADNNLHIDNVSAGIPVAATAWQTAPLAEEVPYELTGLNPDTYYEVVVEGNCGEDTSVESASVFFTTLPSCLAPEGLALANVENNLTPHTATLSWTANGTETEWVIEYTAIVNEEAVIDSINVTENPYTLNSLLDLTPYAVRVKAYCSATDQSDWSNTVRFTTPVACPAPTNLAVDDITVDSATLTWTGTSDNYIVMIGVSDPENEEVIPILNTLVDTDFEDQAIPASFTNSTSYPWTVTAGGAGGSGYCAIPGNNGVNSSTSDLTFVVTGPGSVSFKAKVSSESSYDWGRFLIDGTQKMNISGTQDWTAYSYELAEGEHTLVWRYYKDSSTSSGSDLFYVDDIMISGSEFVPVPSSWAEFPAEDATYTFSNLEAGTTYVVKVKSDCGEDEIGRMSDPIIFTTIASCPAPTDFAVTGVTAHTATMVWNGTNESYMVNYRIPSYLDGIEEEFGTTLPTGWEMYTGLLSNGTATLVTPTYYVWTFGTGNGVFDNHARVNIYGDGQKWLVMPEFEVPADINLNFDIALTAYYGSEVPAPATTGTDDKFIVLISTNDMATWTTLREWNNSGSEYVYNDIANTATGEHVSIDLSAYAGQNVRIAFYGESTTSNADNNLHIDNVTAGVTVPATEWIPVAAADTTIVIDSLAAETTYEAKLQGICDGEESDWTAIITFTTTEACPAITRLDTISVDAHEAVLSWHENGLASEWQICVNGDENNLIVATDTIHTLEGLKQDWDYTVKVRANCGDEDGTSDWSNLISFHTKVACAAPDSLAVDIDNIGTESATVMWTGESDSYIVRYNPWYQVGNDTVGTGEFITHTYDLSEYSGKGSIAIRHYNISDLFWLNVDDIELTNAAGDIIYTQNFENCNGVIPSEISTMDLDGDGHNWQIISTGMNVNGSYGIGSESYDNEVTYEALYPDNWLIISGVELGGQFSFAARGQQAAFAEENFGVFVSPEAGAGEEIVEGDNTIDLWDLIPNTTYAWQVAGVCGADTSNWVSSYFTTKDDVLVFVTAGNWNSVENWQPQELPTVGKNVRIEANAVIPAGVIAEANQITIDTTGSITIKDGGQLKQSSNALKVTMEKEIAGYNVAVAAAGDDEGLREDEVENNNYYLIATPFNGVTILGASTWNHVDSLIYDPYDLYTFDPANGVDKEWVNYKANPSHANFVYESNGQNCLVPNEGYLYANANNKTLVFKGTINKSNNNYKEKTIAYTELNKGWVLVGNPFTCNAYLTVINDEGETEANYYVMNDTGDEFVLAETTDGIAPLTAAFVNFDTTAVKVRINSEMPQPVADSNAKFHGATGKFVMNLSQDGNNVDKAVVRFGKGLNLEKMSLKNNSKLYIPAKDKEYAVVYSRNTANIPVSFKAETAGSYTINCAAEGVSFSELILVDNANDTKVDLLANPSYTFETEAGEFAGRFTIVYKVK